MKKSIEILALATALFIILFVNIIFSNPDSLFETPRKCSDVWGGEFCNSTTLNDCFKGPGGLNGTQLNGCNGTQYWNSVGSWPYISEVYINATNLFPDSGINVTCEFKQNAGTGLFDFEYLWYYNTSQWINIQNWTNSTAGTFNRSSVFNVNATEGTHIVRCIISYNFSAPINYNGSISDECANITYSHYYDNDDANFTVTNHLTYDFWNLTNYTNGSEIASNQTYNRNTLINVSANWSKVMYNAWIEHNGTGTWRNYTICTYPNCIGNWTNYTLNLSNESEFNVATIAIRSIYANDTFSATNNTSPLLYFFLQIGNAPNITNFWFNYSNIRTNQTNKYTNLTIYANVSDDVGLSTVIANVTYPDNNSFNVTMSGSPCYLPQWCLWNYTFGNDNKLNQTGNYTVRIIARNIGGQEKRSGVDYPEENMTFYVNNSYKLLNLSTNYSTYNRGENITAQVWDVNDFPVYNLNWNVTLLKDGQTPNITNYSSTNYTYQIANDDPDGNYTLSVNASKDNNTINNTWQFNVSKSLSLTISTSQALSPGNLVTFSESLYNVRGEPYNNTVNADITCPDGMHTLNFSSGQASYSCTIPSTYSTSFTVYVNASDQYNNSGESTATYTTTAAPSSGGSPGGGGGSVPTEIKKCSDNTTYNQCSLKNHPLYCSNGTLINKCSICLCPNGYSCQPDESCILTKEEDFNFTVDMEKIEIEQGRDFEIKGHLTNTGNTILELKSFLNISEDCCNVSMPSTFELKEKEEREFQISIHIPLFTNTSDYWVKIGIGTDIVKKEKLIDVTVLKSSYFDYLSEIESLLTNIENEIQDYKKAGINTANLENLINQSRAVLSEASSSINNDQVNALAGSITDLKNNINYVSTSLTLLRGQRFLSQNTWLIILLILSCIMTVYMIPEVLVPLYKTDTEIKKLRDEEKVSVSSRVETEKQYFMRKIDENTFSKIMIGKQDSILKLRATLTEKENERKKILQRIHPKEMLKWFWSGIKNLPKNVRNIFKTIKINLFKKAKIK